MDLKTLMENRAVRGAGLGAVIGAVAAMAMGNKSIINYALIGAALGVGAGYLMDKNK